MQKRAQLALFFIVGVILLAAAFFLPVLMDAERTQSPNLEQTIELPSEFIGIHNYVDACIKEVGEDAIVHIAEHGGFYSTSDDIAFYYYRNQNLAPSLQTVQRELSKYVDDFLSECLNDFSDFISQGYDIQVKDSNTASLILENGVGYTVAMPLSVQKGDQHHVFDSFSAEIDSVRLKTLVEVAQKTVDDQMGRVGLCGSCLFHDAEEHDIFIDVYYSEDYDLLFNITDPHSVFDRAPLQFRFINQVEEISCNSIPEYIDVDEKQRYIADCVAREVNT